MTVFREGEKVPPSVVKREDRPALGGYNGLQQASLPRHRRNSTQLGEPQKIYRNGHDGQKADRDKHPRRWVGSIFLWVGLIVQPATPQRNRTGIQARGEVFVPGFRSWCFLLDRASLRASGSSRGVPCVHAGRTTMEFHCKYTATNPARTASRRAE